MRVIFGRQLRVESDGWAGLASLNKLDSTAASQTYPSASRAAPSCCSTAPSGFLPAVPAPLPAALAPLPAAPAPLLVDVDFGAVANVDLPVASYVLGFDVDNDKRPDLSFTIPELPGGATYEVIATSDDTGVFLSAFLPDNTFVKIEADAS